MGLLDIIFITKLNFPDPKSRRVKWPAKSLGSLTWTWLSAVINPLVKSGMAQIHPVGSTSVPVSNSLPGARAPLHATRVPELLRPPSAALADSITLKANIVNVG